MLFKVIIVILFLPFVEITLLVFASNFLSLLHIFSIILISALIGFYCLFRAKLGAKQTLHLIFEPATSIEHQIFDAFAWCISGLLLIIPGLFSDTIGLLIIIYAVLTTRKISSPSSANPEKSDLKGATIEGEYRNEKQ